MKRLAATILAGVAVFSFSAYAQFDPHDYTCEVYPVSAADEATFHGQSGNVAAFWANWSGKDYADMTTTQNSWLPGADQWTGADDAEFKMYAASGANGLYLLFDITDNAWVPPADYAADGIDFLLDKINANDIMTANPYDLYIQPSWGWTLTYYSIQFQVNVGGASLADYIYINYFSGSAMAYNKITLAQLATDYNGLNLNLKTVSGTERQLELFIPWLWVGCGGGLGAAPAPATKFALAGGYNDQDPGMATGARKCLRWKQKDPFNTCSDQNPPATFCDAWGDLEMFGTTATKAPVKNHVATAAVSNVRYFTLNGQSISAAQLPTMKAGTLVLQKEILSNGTLRAQMIHTK